MARSPNRLTPNYARRFLGLDIGGGRRDGARRTRRRGPPGRGRDGAGALCRGLRRGAQRRARGARLQASRRFRQSGLGRDGRPRRHRFPRHPKEMRHPVRSARAISSSSRARAAISCASMSRWTGSPSAALRAVTLDDVIGAAQRVLRPYKFEVKETAWWSVYEVGQRLTDHFDDASPLPAGTRDPRVFIAGDACHTHSAKAGQGMNVSVQDGFNLGWKLAAVLRGRAPAALLATYSAERRAIAQKLIDFDREWSSMMAAPLKSPDDAARRRSRRPAGLFCPARALHRRRDDALRALGADRGRRASGSGGGLCRRNALPFGARSCGSPTPRRSNSARS